MPKNAQSGADTFDESETEDGITDEECSNMEIEYIPLPNGRSVEQ